MSTYVHDHPCHHDGDNAPPPPTKRLRANEDNKEGNTNAFIHFFGNRWDYVWCLLVLNSSSMDHTTVIKMPAMVQPDELTWPKGEPNVFQYYTKRDHLGRRKIRVDVADALRACNGVLGQCQGRGKIMITLNHGAKSDIVWARMQDALAKLGFHNVNRGDFELEEYQPVSSFFDSKANQFCLATPSSGIKEPTTTSSASTTTSSSTTTTTKTPHNYSGNIVCYLRVSITDFRVITNFHTLCDDEKLDNKEFHELDQHFSVQASAFVKNTILIRPWCIGDASRCDASPYRFPIDGVVYDDSMDVAFTGPMSTVECINQFRAFVQSFDDSGPNRWTQWNVYRRVYFDLEDILSGGHEQLKNYKFFMKLSRTVSENNIVTESNELELAFKRISSKGYLNDVKNGSFVFTVVKSRFLHTIPGDCGSLIIARIYESSVAVCEFPIAFHYQRSRHVGWELYAIPLLPCIDAMNIEPDDEGIWTMSRPTITIISRWEEAQEKSQFVY